MTDSPDKNKDLRKRLLRQSVKLDHLRMDIKPFLPSLIGIVETTVGDPDGSYVLSYDLFKVVQLLCKLSLAEASFREAEIELSKD